MTTKLLPASEDKTTDEQLMAALVPDRNDSAHISDHLFFTIDPNMIVIKGDIARFLDQVGINLLSNYLALQGTELPRFTRVWDDFVPGLELGKPPGVWSYMANQLPESASSIDDYRRSEMPQAAFLALKVEFDAAKGEDFEDGLESSFSTALELVVQTYGDVAVNAIARILNRPDVGSEVIAETLRQLGTLVHPPSLRIRKELLITYLQQEVLKFRDASAHGLAGLDDPTSIPQLREAFEHEPHPLIKRKLQAVLNQLQSVQP